MNYGLPKSISLGGREYAIRSDYRVTMDIFEILNDVDLTDEERGQLALLFFYEEEIPFELEAEATAGLFWFIRGGREEHGNVSNRRLMDWEQDYPLIIAPVNRIIGHDVRGDEYLHWWTFLSAFMEIGDCTFSQVLHIRTARAEGKKLDKTDAEWYRKNKDIVDLRGKYSEAENDLLRIWGGGM